MEKELEKMSSGPGLYMLNSAFQNNDIVYPFSPTITIQKSGGSRIDGIPLIDVDTELMGLNRIQSNDPETKYKPTKTNFKYNHLKDGLFETENTQLLNPTMDLKGMTKNRFDFVHVDPVKFTIEPFNRIGENTYLDTVDNFQECPNPNYK